MSAAFLIGGAREASAADQEKEGDGKSVSSFVRSSLPQPHNILPTSPLFPVQLAKQSKAPADLLRLFDKKVTAAGQPLSKAQSSGRA